MMRPLDPSGGFLGMRRAPPAPPVAPAPPAAPSRASEATERPQGPASRERGPILRPTLPSRGKRWRDGCAILRPDSEAGVVLAAIGWLIAEGRAAERGAVVVRAWQLDPDAFGLRGYPMHPDATAVDRRLMRLLGVEARGCKPFVATVAPCVYSLTPRGESWWRWVGSVESAHRRAGRMAL